MGASGTTTLDFGVFPGSSHATVDVTGQTGFVTTSEVEAWIQPVATPDHSADEHKVETIKVVASYKVDGTITIDAFNTSQLNEPVFGPSAQNWQGGKGTRLYGVWNVAWAWN